MGDVWRAKDAVLRRTVAVKILLPELLANADFAARFRIEAHTMATLDHPGIVDIYDYDHSGDIASLVMQYVDGESLNAMLNRAGTLHPTEAMALVAQAAEALAAVHASGTVHRDVKPGNLLVRTDGRLVLTDFGIARTPAGGQLTNADTVMGTASYLAPELILGEPATPATDLYALGVVAYQCLAGKRPFEATTPLSVALKHVQEQPPPLPAGVPAEARDLVMVALAKEAGGRWPDATAMAEAAWAAAEGMPVPQPATTGGQTVNLSAPSGPAATGPAAAGPTAGGSAVTGPAVTGPPAGAPAGAEADARPTSGVPVVSATDAAVAGEPVPGAVEQTPVGSVPAEPAVASRSAWRPDRILLFTAAAALLIAIGGFVALRLTAPGSAQANDDDTAWPTPEATTSAHATTGPAAVGGSPGYPSGPSGTTVPSNRPGAGQSIPVTKPPAGTPPPSSSPGNNTNSVPVPNVIGFDPDTARKTLTDAGFVVEVRYNNGNGKCKVVNQSPTGGTTATRGDTVTILLKHSCMPGATENLTGDT